MGICPKISLVWLWLAFCRHKMVGHKQGQLQDKRERVHYLYYYNNSTYPTYYSTYTVWWYHIYIFDDAMIHSVFMLF